MVKELSGVNFEIQLHMLGLPRPDSADLAVSSPVW